MKLYETAVRKPISTILIFIGVLIIGGFSLRNLAIDMYPDMDIPYLSVITTYTGANATDIETNITRVLEDNLNTVDNLKKLTSTSSDEMSMITLQMEWGADLDQAANDIRDVIGRISSALPDEADDPILFKFSSSMMPVMVLSATADESYAGLYKLLDDKMVNVLNRIDGVGSVSLFGEPVREIQVNVDPVKLEAYNLTVEQIGQIIANENSNIPSGTLEIGNNQFNVKADGEFNSSDDLKDIVISNYNGRTIMLEDVAEIKDTIEKMTIDERINGKRGVRVLIQKQSGANSVAIVKDVTAELENIKETLPNDVKIDVVMDSSESIVDSINSLEETVMFAFLFVIIVVLFFLGRWRATFIICLTIPISLITAFIYLYGTGSTLNIISLSSLSIAIGMVVDDAIVVLENITKHIERGSTPREAAIYATNEVWLAVIATTLVVVAVFLPLTMVSGMAGIMFRELGWIVTIVICVSTLAAITLTPMLSSLMLKAETKHQYKGLGIIFKPIDKFLDKLDEGYAKLLAWTVRHRLLVICSTFVLFFASLGVFMAGFIPIEFMPTSDTSIITMNVQLQQNLNVDYTVKTARKIDSIINVKYPEIYLLSTSTGESSNSQSRMLSSDAASYAINYTMRLVKPHERERSMFLISDLLRQDLDQIPEVRQYTVTPGGNRGGSVGGISTISLKVFGQDLNQTNDVALYLKDKISQLSTTRDVQLSRDDMRPEYNIVFDREKLALYGLNSTTVATAIRNRLNGLTASLYREDGDEYDIIVRYAEPFRTSFEDIENITVYGSEGQPIKVKDVATITEEFAPPIIERENRQRQVTVEISLGDGVALGTAVQEINDKVLADYQIPDGVYLEMGGSVEDQQDSFSDLTTLLVLIILLVYIVMATQFESLLMPFIIMLTVVPAFTGVIVALWATNTPLSLIALLGAIMLVGIVVKNGIVMVDYTNLLRERGSAINQAVIVSGKSRLRPVLMTSLTTILGMVPLAIGTGEGSEIWQPMGIAIIGGLTFSTFLTLLLVPCLYSVFVGSGLKKEKKAINKKRKEEKRKRNEFQEAKALK